MTRGRFEEIMGSESKSLKYEHDPIFLGLEVLHKYFPLSRVLEGANHDIVYSFNIDALITANITEEDATKLNEYGWHIDKECDCLARFV